MNTTMGFMLPYQHLIAGTTAGLVTTSLLYPLELVKTRMQVLQKEAGYATTAASIRSVLEGEGAGGMYRGITPALFASAGSWGGYFYFYELSKKRKLNAINMEGDANYGDTRVGAEKKLGVKDHLLSGIEAGVFLVMIFNPIFLVKTRMALQGTDTNNKRYAGMFDALKTIVREEGARGLYKGLVPALLLTSHGAVQFASYEYMKEATTKISESSMTSPLIKGFLSSFQSLLLGGVSKIIASSATYPYQVIKSRLQQRGTGGVYKYKGTLDCANKLWKEGGVRAFFRGIVPSTLKVAPGSALTFFVYEETVKFIRKGNE
jgi:solute carrier family 25 folate transporter 32